ncbi:uncharacterized protein RVIR1_03990 [Candidatus Rickettsiella viridis]|uniref:2-oxoadipate dioxygenase/decarboxylase n=1 Tax=Candidatus Rickettsiella viridis TaxID=676208 RepID=A0A2Z5UVC8_9COXI|nr:DUF1338 family protein [Candidatus Rickettsiella viridis]BBB14913.1 uncharacterized protein RVIR1_03990 [Candidatus Rickettsiella viridis]
MLNQAKKLIIQQLWRNYAVDLWPVSRIQTALKAQYNEVMRWDHFALIDLPGPYTGIGPLSNLFKQLEYEVRGRDYLAEKQNDFMWLSEQCIETQPAENALPQVVVADFRREALVPEVRKIIDAYACQSKPLDIEYLSRLKKRLLSQDETAVYELLNFVTHYLRGRDWPLPTVKEFTTVKNNNELLAWVLVMGRQVNHFGWAIHLSKKFKSLSLFNQFVSQTLGIGLNANGGLIKGQIEKGIEQSSSAAIVKSIQLADGAVDLSDRFIEFVWRYPIIPMNEKPCFAKDYFSGFIANQADSVVESLYLNR